MASYRQEILIQMPPHPQLFLFLSTLRSITNSSYTWEDFKATRANTSTFAICTLPETLYNPSTINAMGTES